MTKIFLESMTAVFKSPYGSNQEQERTAMRDYRDVLDAFDRDTKDEAWRRLRIRHKKVSWPLPGEVYAVCSEITGEKKKPGVVDEREAMTSPGGRRALQIGVAWRFLQRCEEYSCIWTERTADRIWQMYGPDKFPREEELRERYCMNTYGSE